MAITVFNKEAIEYGSIVNLETIVCYSCGVPFAIPDNLKRHFHETKESFYCPNGHRQCYTKSTEDFLREKLQQQAEKSKIELERMERQRNDAIKDRIVLKGKLTKVNNRIKNGVCPCCNRTFQDLQMHMKTKHPDFITINPLHTKG